MVALLLKEELVMTGCTCSALHWKKSEISRTFVDKEMSRTGKFPGEDSRVQYKF